MPKTPTPGSGNLVDSPAPSGDYQDPGSALNPSKTLGALPPHDELLDDTIHLVTACNDL
jgi:hypothetical protein